MSLININTDLHEYIWVIFSFLERVIDLVYFSASCLWLSVAEMEDKISLFIRLGGVLPQTEVLLVQKDIITRRIVGVGCVCARSSYLKS